ncbi:MAG TPA: hypothetical protein VE170_11305 [Candidatus Limnocylindria bacterium]|nr:hypothetical protein [Candidatus Limnocylindria bacterium]
MSSRWWKIAHSKLKLAAIDPQIAEDLNRHASESARFIFANVVSLRRVPADSAIERAWRFKTAGSNLCHFIPVSIVFARCDEHRPSSFRDLPRICFFFTGDFCYSNSILVMKERLSRHGLKSKNSNQS